MLYPIAICLSVRIKQRFSWTRCIFMLTNHIFAEQYILVNCVSSLNLLCFIEKLKYILVWSSPKKINYVFISFFWIYTYRFVNSVVTVIPLIPYYYQLYKIPNKKQTDYQSSSHQKFTLYIYEKVFTCKNFVCKKTLSLLCVIKNPAI